MRAIHWCTIVAAVSGNAHVSVVRRLTSKALLQFGARKSAGSVKEGNRVTVLALSMLLAGCVSGDWANFAYGPGDWLNDNTNLNVDTMYNYAHLIEPTIDIHYVDSLTNYCGSIWARGCAVLKGDHCDIYIGKNGSRGTLEHEMRHCYGWDHFRPRVELFLSMSPEEREREVKRTKAWYPGRHTDATIAGIRYHFEQD
ncbi:MAG: hypothetical protein HRT77_13390 [Halioglobus sp.]|nr:hypothetical protein [Halioglobus sp.]